MGCRHSHAVAGCRGCLVAAEGFLGGLSARYALGVAYGGDGVALRGELASLYEVVYAGHERAGVVVGEDRQAVGNPDGIFYGFFAVGTFLRGVEDADTHEILAARAVVESFHCGEFHGLGIGHVDSRHVTGPGSQHYSGKSNPRSHFHGVLGKLHVALFQQEPAADAYHEHGAEYPPRQHGVEEFYHRRVRERHCGEVGHDVAHLRRVEVHSHRVLHPGVGHQNPVGRQRDADSGEPCGGEVESGRHPLPPEEHHRDECALEEERRYPFDSQGSAENITHEPGIVAPVRAEFELENNARSHAAGEIDTEQEHPEFCHPLPAFVAGFQIDALHDAHYQRQADGQRHEEPVHYRRECKLAA